MRVIVTAYIITISTAPLRTLLRRQACKGGFMAWGSPLETTTTTVMSTSWSQTSVEISFITTTATARSQMLRPRQAWAPADGQRGCASVTWAGTGGWLGQA